MRFGASMDALERRVRYGGRKGRSAARRLAKQKRFLDTFVDLFGPRMEAQWRMVVDTINGGLGDYIARQVDGDRQ